MRHSEPTKTWKLAMSLVVLLPFFVGCSGGAKPIEAEQDGGLTFSDSLLGKNDLAGIAKDADQVCPLVCGGKECGDDGCGGSCGDCGGDATCSLAGVCVEMDCSGKEYNLSGTFANSVKEFSFDTVDVAMYHKKDIDPGEDGCIAQVDLSFRKGIGCLLELRAEGAFDSQGRLRITEFNFQVDSQCPGFSDAMEGGYEGLDNLTDAAVTLADTEVMMDNIDSWCFPSSLTVHLAGTIFSLDAGAQIQVLPTALTVSGSFLSVGDEGLNCPCKAKCEGKACGGDGCGGSCGSCPNGFYCEAGTCKEGDCLPDCEGKECGGDGCDGICGDCVEGYYCDQGTCKEGECVPECDGKECGPNGCGGICGDCGCGEVCEGAACTFHACDGKFCGNDGCGGECGTCGEGLACSNGMCVNVGCQAQSLVLDGDFNTVVSAITFDSVVASVVHKRDVDEWEDGCIASVVLTFKKGPGCALTVVAGDSFDLDGHLQVQQVSFSADSQCPGFPDDKEGTYSGVSDLASVWLDLGVNEVPGYDVEESCLNTAMKLHLEGTLHGGAPGKTLQILPTELSISGDFKSLGDYGVSCPCKPSCQGKECGDAGCGATCGTCPGGKSCDGGQCVVVCGDGECGVGEHKCNCPGDCTGGCAGCCSGTQCETGDKLAFCGTGGEACDECTGGEVCQAENCVCTAEHHQSCSAGKLYWYDSCNVQGSLVNNCDDANACTTDGCSGSQCTYTNVGNDTPCGNEQSCQGGVCQVHCGDGLCGIGEDKCNCPGDCTGGCAGCCAGGECKAGTSNGECGKSGAVCTNCSATGKECQSQACVVPPTWTDPTSGLTWQVTPTGGSMGWNKAKTHCANLSLDGGGWHLPTIGELRTLIRGCPATEAGGSCNIEEGDCLAWGCWADSCKGCSTGDGPADGCYWPDSIIGPCSWYWSSSPVEDLVGYAWHVYFDLGYVGGHDVYHDLHVRCVR